MANFKEMHKQKTNMFASLIGKIENFLRKRKNGQKEQSF